MGTLLLLFCVCFAALLTPPMLSMAQADEDEIKPPPGRPAEDLKTPEVQYFINIAPLPPGKPCNPSSHDQVVIFWFVMASAICIFLWAMGLSLYRGWRLRKQRELVTTRSDSATVAFANSDGIPPSTSVPSGDNSAVNPPPICTLQTDSSPVMPSAPPLEVLACHRCGYPECNILPLQFVCPSCGNMWPVN